MEIPQIGIALFSKAIVEYAILPTDGLPMQFDEIRIECLKANWLRERYEKNRTTLPVLSLRPAQSDSAKLMV